MHEAEPAIIETFDILRLLKSLPHRYPFLMIDRVIEARGGIRHRHQECQH